MHLWRLHSLTLFAAAVSGAVMLAPVSAAGTTFRAPADTDTWPMFGRDPLHSGISPDTAIGASTATGLAVKWSQPLGTPHDQPSPVAAYNSARKQTLIYDVTFPGVVSAFSASTGHLAWRHKVAAGVFSTPAVYGNTVYFGSNGGTLEALNAATGAVQCTFTLPVTPPATNPGHIISSPVVGNVDGTGPTVFFGDTGVPSAKDALTKGHLWAVTGVGNTAGACQQKWTYSDWPNPGSGGMVTGVWDGPGLVQQSNGIWTVVFGGSNPDGAVYALNAATGARLWRFQTAQTGEDQDVGAGPTISPPGGNGFADGVVYVDGKDGVEYALNLHTGKKIWSFMLGPGSASALSISTAALAGNTLAVGYSGSMFALNATTGTAIWKATPGGRFEASPAVSGGTGDQVVFAGNTNGQEYGFSLATGAQLFSASAISQIQDSTAVADGTVYFAGGGTLYAYAPTGTAG
jgi:outer membrane protein assembly factor BamB